MEHSPSQISFTAAITHLVLRIGLDVKTSALHLSLLLTLVIGGMALSLIGMTFEATGHLSPVYGDIALKNIVVLAVLNALRAAFPPAVIHDL